MVRKFRAVDQNSAEHLIFQGVPKCHILLYNLRTKNETNNVNIIASSSHFPEFISFVLGQLSLKEWLKNTAR